MYFRFRLKRSNSIMRPASRVIMKFKNSYRRIKNWDRVRLQGVAFGNAQENCWQEPRKSLLIKFCASNFIPFNKATWFIFLYKTRIFNCCRRAVARAAWHALHSNVLDEEEKSMIFPPFSIDCNDERLLYTIISASAMQFSPLDLFDFFSVGFACHVNLRARAASSLFYGSFENILLQSAEIR